MKIEGQCHCGAIVYQAELDPEKVGICHCSDCQALSASSFRTIAMVTRDSFEILKGSPKKYIKVGDSGTPRVQAFCSECGSGLYSTSVDDQPEVFNLRVGTITQRHKLIPRFECWKQSALGWMPEIEHTMKFVQNPKLG